MTSTRKLVEIQYQANKSWSNTKHPNAGRIPSNQMLFEYQATKSWSEYTTAQQARAGQNIQPMTQSEKSELCNPESERFL